MVAFVAGTCRGKPTTPVHVIRAHPTTAGQFWVGGDLGLFTTDDMEGKRFALQSFGSAVRDIVWMSDSTVVLALEDQGLIRSTDGGASWTFPPCLPTWKVWGGFNLQVNRGSTSRDTLYAVAGHDLQQNFLGFWRSVDAGATWEAMATKASGPNLLGVAVDGSDNLGKAFWDLCLEVNPTNASHVLVGGINLWSTMDGGQTGRASFTGKVRPRRAEPTPTNTTSCGWTTATWWCPTTAGCSVGTIQGCPICLRVCKSPRRMRWACTQPSLQLMLGSQDNGTSHQTPLHQARVLDGDGFDCFFNGNTTDTLYASAYYGLLYRSTDGGRTMTQVASYFGGQDPSTKWGHGTRRFNRTRRAWTDRNSQEIIALFRRRRESWTTWSGTGDVRSTALALSSSDPEVALLAKNNVLYARHGQRGSSKSMACQGLQIGDVSYAQSGSNQEWWVAFAGYEETPKCGGPSMVAQPGTTERWTSQFAHPLLAGADRRHVDVRL